MTTETNEPNAPAGGVPDADLEGLLVEFTSSKPAAAQPPGPQSDARQGFTKDDLPALEALMIDRRKGLFDNLQPGFKLPDTNSPEFQQRAKIEALERHAQAVDAERLRENRQRHDQAAVAAIFDQHADAIAGLTNLPPDVVRLRAAAELQINGELQEIIKHRFDNPESWEKAKSAMGKTVDRIVRQAQKENARLDPYNRQITEDRDAVTASVRGAAKVPPPPKQVNIMDGKMSDKDAKAHVEKEYGYVPNY